MKTWEVIKALYENPKLRFKNLRFGGVLGYLEDGHLGWISGTSTEGAHFSICYVKEPIYKYSDGNWNDDWELVHEPVDFITAVKAYHEGRTIKSSDGQCSHTYSESNQENFSQCGILDENGDAPDAFEILKSKWYIIS